jgi:hypothetical protein
MARGRSISCAVILALFTAGISYADKLVVFHNGRTLRVTDMRQEDDWSFLTLGEKGEIGVPDRLIASVIDVEGGEAVPLPNVQAAAAGGGGAPGPGGVPRPNRRAGNRRDANRAVPPVTDPSAAADVDEDARARAAKARSDALARAAARAGRNRQTNQEAPGTAPGTEELPPGIELSAPQDGSRWPSLLDRGKGREPSQPESPREGESDD